MNDFLNTQESRKNNRTKNIIGVIVGVVSFIVVFLAAFFTTRYLTSSFFSKAKNDLVTDEMKNQVAEMNQQLPQIIEEGVRLDSIALKGEKTMGYYATLFNFDSEGVEFDASAAKEAIVQNLKSNRGKMRFFIDNNITLYYYYYDKNKKVVTEIEIAPSLYK
ncbi:hypothetical protein HMPREF1320_2005 [Capnocytophaga sp. oral taxon 335 str. F0486]|uniref:hypothetical protein n=1 Tax=Capnocytophaga sp. oral taxon 335 TaxID=712215 RepID=UPI00026F3F10|nr:hypothetical protein [Capnocytophaga sp. oral taxon 335]EJF38014.1 hypothetical protein HMPREF1320_2005 [Capnocytophaga sp. oral taxon 335 str. F0486]